MSSFIIMLLVGVFVSAVTFINSFVGFMPSFVVPFVFAVYTIGLIYSIKE